MALTRVTYFVDEHDRIYNAPTTLTFLTRDEAVQWAIDNDPVYNIVSVIEEGVGTIPPPWTVPLSYQEDDDVHFPGSVFSEGLKLGAGAFIVDDAATLAGANPLIPAGQYGVEEDTGLVKFGPGLWNALAYANGGSLISTQPEEILLTPSGIDVNIELSDLIARHALIHDAVGQFYTNAMGAVSAQALTLDQLVLVPVWMTKGTIDQVGIDVSTQATAGGVVRAGFATNVSGMPNAVIGEGVIDSTATGYRSASPTIVIPQNDKYWLYAVSQVAACSINAANAGTNNPIQIPLGTAGPSGTTAWFSRIKANVTSTPTTPISASINGNPQAARIRVFWRYSAIG